jgi:GNAT superfamily N-acetyltransferase
VCKRPKELYDSLLHAHTLLTAWAGHRLVGLAYSISDGFLVVYYPHVIVLPDYQGRGIATGLMKMMVGRYKDKDFYQQVLIKEKMGITLYERLGFRDIPKVEPLWIYRGRDL